MVIVDDLSIRVKTSYHHPSRNDVDHKFHGCNSFHQHAMAEKMLLIDLTMKSFQTTNPTAERYQIINPTVKRPRIINPTYKRKQIIGSATQKMWMIALTLRLRLLYHHIKDISQVELKLWSYFKIFSFFSFFSKFRSWPRRKESSPKVSHSSFPIENLNNSK